MNRFHGGLGVGTDAGPSSAASTRARARSLRKRSAGGEKAHQPSALRGWHTHVKHMLYPTAHLSSGIRAGNGEKGMQVISSIWGSSGSEIGYLAPSGADGRGRGGDCISAPIGSRKRAFCNHSSDIYAFVVRGGGGFDSVMVKLSYERRFPRRFFTPLKERARRRSARSTRSKGLRGSISRPARR
jgi:hypothetical protein